MNQHDVNAQEGTQKVKSSDHQVNIRHCVFILTSPGVKMSLMSNIMYNITPRPVAPFLWGLSESPPQFASGGEACERTLVKHSIISAPSPRSIKGPFQNTVLHSASFAVSITTAEGWKNVLYNLQDSIQTREHTAAAHTHLSGNTHTHNYTLTTAWHI